MSTEKLVKVTKYYDTMSTMNNYNVTTNFYQVCVT